MINKNKKRSILSLLVAAALAGVVGFSLVALSACNNNGKKIRDAYKSYFKIGVALDVQGENADEYAFRYDDDFVKQFSSITAENEMKWLYTEGSKGVYTYQKGDFIVKKAKQLGMAVRGHALVWHSSTPDYVRNHAKNTDLGKAKADVLDDIREHVYNTVTHFSEGDGKKVVYCWDVVNEAISDSGNPDEVFRSSAYYDSCGEDFIFEAFKEARRADPNVKLYYNDYNLNQPVKRAKAIKLIKDMQAAGVPIDGIGEQAHYDIRNFDPVEFEKMIVEFKDLGLDVQITELDFSVYADDNEEFDYLSDELAELQAKAYGKVFEICRKYKDVIKGVTLWGAADDHTWLTNRTDKSLQRYDYPLLFDEEHEKKPAYYAVMDFKDKYVADKNKTNDDYYNVYNGKGDFHISKWDGGNYTDTYIDVTGEKPINGETATEIYYYKQKPHTEAVTKITGDLRKFRYLNLTLSADHEMTVMAQMNYFIGFSDESGDISEKALGEEPFTVDKTKKTYSIKIPDNKLIYLNLLDEVWLFPDPGEIRDADNNALKGNFYVYDVWFSETSPEGAELITPVAGSGGAAEMVKKCGEYTWYNETSWTKVNMSSTSKGMRIASGGAADWSYVSVQLDKFKETDDKLEIVFYDNGTEGNKNALEYLRFRLRAKPLEMCYDGINTYMTYEDRDLVDFIMDPAFKESYEKVENGWPESVTYDAATGKYTLVYEIGAEIRSLLNIKAIEDYSKGGYGLRLVILAESVGVSHKPDGSSIDYKSKIVYPDFYSDETLRGEIVKGDKKFDITVESVRTFSE